MYFCIVDICEIEEHSNRCEDLLVALSTTIFAIRDIDKDRLELVSSQQLTMNAAMCSVVIEFIVRLLMIQNVI